MIARKSLVEAVEGELQALKQAGLYKSERIIASEQGATLRLEDGSEVLNFCANNYLGLANDPRLVDAAKEAMDDYGHGMASVRFICGTLDLHKKLERKVADFLGMDDAILYAAAFDANGGLFEPLLGPEDAIISDALNHASIIDGVRLCKAKRYRYESGSMTSLEAQLQQADRDGSRRRLIVSDGVFSMDGTVANLEGIATLADQYGALTLIDECHATGFMGRGGRGTHEHCDVMGRIDLITGTFGKALGGASGGFTAGPKAVVELLRQRSRPYLFSNALAPAITGSAIAALDLLSSSDDLRTKLFDNTRRFREGMTAAGFDLKEGDHPIVPVMLYDAQLAQRLASELLKKGLYVVGFSYPVVPRGEARVRVQLSAAHTSEQVERAVAAFSEVAEQVGVPTKKGGQ